MPIEDLQCSYKNSFGPFLCQLQKSAMSRDFNSNYAKFSAAFATRRSFKILAYLVFLLLAGTFQLASSTEFNSTALSTKSVETAGTRISPITSAVKSTSSVTKEYLRNMTHLTPRTVKHGEDRLTEVLVNKFNTMSSGNLSMPINSFWSTLITTSRLERLINSRIMRSSMGSLKTAVLVNYLTGNHPTLNISDEQFNNPTLNTSDEQFHNPTSNTSDEQFNIDSAKNRIIHSSSVLNSSKEIAEPAESGGNSDYSSRQNELNERYSGTRRHILNRYRRGLKKAYYVLYKHRPRVPSNNRTKRAKSFITKYDRQIHKTARHSKDLNLSRDVSEPGNVNDREAVHKKFYYLTRFGHSDSAVTSQDLTASSYSGYSGNFRNFSASSDLPSRRFPRRTSANPDSFGRVRANPGSFGRVRSLQLLTDISNRTKRSSLSDLKTSHLLSNTLSPKVRGRDEPLSGVQSSGQVESSSALRSRRRSRRGLNSFQAGHGSTREARIYNKKRRGFIQFSPLEGDRISVNKLHSRNGSDIIEISFLCQQAGLYLGPCPHVTSSSNMTSQGGSGSVLEVILLRFQAANRYICVDSSARIYLKETLDRKPHECAFRHKLLDHKHDIYYSHAYPDLLRRCSKRPSRSARKKTLSAYVATSPANVTADISANMDFTDSRTRTGSSYRDSQFRSYAPRNPASRRSRSVDDQSRANITGSGNKSMSRPSGSDRGVPKRLNCQARWFLGVNRAGYLRVFKQTQLKSKVLFIQRWINPNQLAQGGVNHPRHVTTDAPVHPNTSLVPSSPSSVLNISLGLPSNVNKRKDWWNFDKKTKRMSKSKLRKCSKLLKSCSRIARTRSAKKNKRRKLS